MEEISIVEKKIDRRIALRESMNVLGVFLLVVAVVLAIVGFSSKEAGMVIAGGIVLILAMVMWLVACERIAKKLAVLKEEYRNQTQKYHLENALAQYGCKRSHFIPEKGLWKEEVVRAGIFDRDSAMELHSDAYLEGEFEQKRFRTSNLEMMQVKPYRPDLIRKMVNGQFWIFTSEIEYPCKLVIFDRKLYQALDHSNKANRWCTENAEMKLYTPEDAKLNERCICFTDHPERAGYILTGTAVTRIFAYAANHPGEVFFISFNYKEMYFFDYAENQDTNPVLEKEPEDPKKPKKFLSHKDILALKQDMQAIDDAAQSRAEKTVTYLTDIMNIFASERINVSRDQAEEFS